MITKLSTKKEIAPIFLGNGVSATVIIPHKLAEKYHISRPCFVVFDEMENGLLLRKLNEEVV